MISETFAKAVIDGIITTIEQYKETDNYSALETLAGIKRMLADIPLSALE